MSPIFCLKFYRVGSLSVSYEKMNALNHRHQFHCHHHNCHHQEHQQNHNNPHQDRHHGEWSPKLLSFPPKAISHLWSIVLNIWIRSQAFSSSYFILAYPLLHRQYKARIGKQEEQIRTPSSILYLQSSG